MFISLFPPLFPVWHHEGVEPSTRLVQTLCNELGREALLEFLLTLHKPNQKRLGIL